MSLSRHSRQRLHTIGLGGIACNCLRAWHKGTAVDLHIPSLGTGARYPGYVAGCRKAENGYRVGISFTDGHALFSARMGEQACRIERYCRQHADAEPTPQYLDAMARKWVARHASEFSHEAFVAPALD